MPSDFAPDILPLTNDKDLYQRIASQYGGEIAIAPSELGGDHGSAEITPNGRIVLREENPYVLAHEIGHTRSRGSWRQRLADIVGGSGNVVYRLPLLRRAGGGLISAGTYMKERAADAKALDVLREAGVSEDMIEKAKRAYLRHSRGQDKKADFAPGLPSKNDRGNTQRLPLDTILTLVRQRHNADRAGLHEDLRIGDPGGLESWAVPKFLPLVEN